MRKTAIHFVGLGIINTIKFNLGNIKLLKSNMLDYSYSLALIFNILILNVCL